MNARRAPRLALVLMVAAVLEITVGCSEKHRSDGSLTFGGAGHPRPALSL